MENKEVKDIVESCMKAVNNLDPVILEALDILDVTMRNTDPHERDTIDYLIHQLLRVYDVLSSHKGRE